MTVPTSARREASNYIYSTGPDVCLTPVGSAIVPVAYNSIVTFENTERTCRSVRDNGRRDFQVNSRPLRVQGHEPGEKKGIVVRGHESHAVVKKGAPTVFSEGYSLVRDGDPARINRPGPGKVETPRTMTTETVEHN